MAASSASRSWATFARRAVTTGAVAAVGLIALAVPASAHTGTAKAGCDKKTDKPAVTVTLVAYLPKTDNEANTVEVFEVDKDGKETSLVKEEFGVEHKETYVFDKLDGKVEHTFKVVVTAIDDEDFKLGFSKEFKDLKSEICDKTPPPNNPPANPPAPPAENPPAPQPAAAPASNALADTGVSIAIPLGIGAALLVGGGALLLMMRRRSRA